MANTAVTFDFGQTLAELDTDMLSQRLAERNLQVPAHRLARAVPAAWLAYDAAITSGGGGHPWHTLMHTLLEQAGLDAARLQETVDWLWDQQPRTNLWRRPIPGMIELVRELAAASVPIGIVSNSEGHLLELARELGWSDCFDVVADSGVLGITKPDAAIFEWTCRELGVSPCNVIHVGDSWRADVDGALAVGMKAIWFGGATGCPPAPQSRRENLRLRKCLTARATKEALASWGVPLTPPP